MADVHLELASLQQIVEELSSRFDAVVVVVDSRARGSVDESDNEICTFYHGGARQAVGMCRWLEHQLLLSSLNDARRGRPSED
jgi:hypothetical protein